MTSSAKKRISGEQQQKLNSFTLSDTSSHSTGHGGVFAGDGNTEKRMSRQDSVETTVDEREDSTAYNPLAGLRENKKHSLPKKKSHRRSSIVDLLGSAISSVKDQVVDTSTSSDDTNDHFLDLQDILDITEEINDDGPSYATRGRKSSSSIGSSNRRDSSDSKRFSAQKQKYTSPVFEESKNDFGDEYSFLEKSNHLNSGYLRKNINKASIIALYQRKYFILTSTMLFFYDKESDVSSHIAGVEGKIFIRDIDRIVQNISSALNFTLILRDGVTYELQAFTAKEADAWFSQLSQVVASVGKVDSGEDEDSALLDLDYDFVDRRRQNITAYRRSSLGGIPAIVNHLKFPTKSNLPTMHGYLEKYNNLFWQKRYFTLVQPGVLCWYGSERDAMSDIAMKNSLQLEKILSVMQSDEDICCFDIDVRGRTYYLRALSAGQAEEWCESLSAWSSFLFLTHNKRGSCTPLVPSAAPPPAAAAGRSGTVRGYSSLQASADGGCEDRDRDMDRDIESGGSGSQLRPRTDSNMSGLTENSSNVGVGGVGVGNHIELSTIPLTSTLLGSGGGKRWSISTFNSLDTRAPEKKQGLVL